MIKSKSIEICSNDFKEIYNNAINFSLYQYITPSLFNQPNIKINDVEKEIYNKLNKFNQENSIFNYLLVSVISIMESYLYNIIIEEIKKDKTLSIKFIEKYKFSRNLTPKDVITGPEKLSIEILKNIIYHNLKKINPIYKIIFNVDILNIEGTNISHIFNFIKIRHKIVHDSGKIKNNKFYVTQDLFINSFTEIYDWLLNIDSLIKNNQIRKRGSNYNNKFYKELLQYTKTPILETGNQKVIIDTFKELWSMPELK